MEYYSAIKYNEFSLFVIAWMDLEAGVSNRLTSLGHTGRKRVVLSHTLNTQTLTKTDEQKKGFK